MTKIILICIFNSNFDVLIKNMFKKLFLIAKSIRYHPSAIIFKLCKHDVERFLNMTTNEVPISDDASDFQHSKKKLLIFQKKKDQNY